MEATENLREERQLLSHDLLKAVKRFMDSNSGEVVGVEASISTMNPTMLMTSDGKCHTGSVILCTVNTWGEPDDDDDFDCDDDD